jgi:hypothetical protein
MPTASPRCSPAFQQRLDIHKGSGIVIQRNRETLRQLAQCGAYAGHLAEAPFAVARIASTAEGFDLGQAAAYMQLTARELGIGS